MDKKVIAGIVVAVLVVGGGIFAASNNSQSTTTPSSAPQQAQTASDQKSLKDLIVSGQSVSCKFSDTESGSEGVMYISSGKSRGDFSTSSQGQVMKTHMIFDKESSYMWMDNSTTGYKMSLSAAKPSGTQNNSQGMDPDKKMDYKCDPWTADSSMFDLPKGVTFSAMGAMMAAPSGSVTGTQVTGTQNSNDSQCAACDSAPADTKAQCRAALNCK